MLQCIKWIGMAQCALHECSDVSSVNFWICLCHRVYSYEKNDSVSESCASFIIMMVHTPVPVPHA
jgi:hypothetical protein